MGDRSQWIIRNPGEKTSKLAKEMKKVIGQEEFFEFIDKTLKGPGSLTEIFNSVIFLTKMKIP